MTRRDRFRRRAPLSAALAGLLLGLLAAALPAAATPGGLLVVRADDTVLRAAPDAAAAAVMRLTPDHRLIEFERRGGWVRVGVFREVGAFGWLPLALVAPAPPPALPPKPVAAAPPERPSYRLDVTGTPALKFRARCTLVDAAGRYRSVRLSAGIPKSYAFDGAAAVACVVQKWDAFGRLRARLSRGQERLVARSTRAAFNFVRLRSAGPWGAGGGAVGNIPTFRVTQPTAAP